MQLRSEAFKKALTKPHVLLALLALLSALGYLFGNMVNVSRRTKPPVVELTSAVEDAAITSEIRLVLYDSTGLERPMFLTVRLPESETERLHGIVEALRGELFRRGVWPDALPLPLVFVEQLEGRRVAVLDFDLPAPVAVPVGVELQLLRSIEATVLANDIDRVRILTNGTPRATFLGHIALPQAL